MDGFNEPATILIAAGTDNGDGSWISWIQSSAIGLFWIYWVLLFLIVFLRILKETGVTDFLTRMLTPVLRLIGIGPNAAPLAMVGILLGLSFGGALILREIQKAGLNPKSIFLSMVFMGFCHSLIEDTLIAIAFGGHWSGVFVGRIVVAILLILPISYCILKMPDRIFHSLLFKANKDIPDQKTEK
nr:nucleoside recognition domain-containing protein [Sneathiella chinensis]